MSRVRLMGIVNVTPDSFSDGNEYFLPEQAIARAEELFGEGASIVDIGAESTRPNATALTPAEEWDRLEPVLRVVLPAHPGQISLDSYHPETIDRAARAFGRTFWANDVTGCNNPAMVATVASHHLPIIVSHLPSQFGADIQAAHKGPLIDDIGQVKRELLERAAALGTAGTARNDIILDPGIGFGKTPELNRRLLEFAQLLPDWSVLIGYSRKRFLGESRFSVEANLAAGRIAIDAGAAYLRVHDLAEHRSLIS